MSIFDSIRRWARTPRHCQPCECGSSVTLFLKLVSRHSLGGLTVSHYITNPDERPDYVLRHSCRFRPRTSNDGTTTRWEIHRITPDEDARLERLEDDAPQERLVAFVDAEGNLLLQAFTSVERAEQLMNAATSPADYERANG